MWGTTCNRTTDVYRAIVSGRTRRAAKALQAKADRAQGERVELPERGEGADLAAQRASVEYDAYRATHVRALLDEIAPDAHTAAQRVEDAVQQLEDARLGLHAVSHRVSAVIASATMGSACHPGHRLAGRRGPVAPA